MLVTTAFEDFGTEHFILLGVFGLGCVLAVVLGRRVRDRPAEVWVRRGLAVLLTAVMLPLQVRDLLPGRFVLGTSLPVQLCDLAWIVAVWALWRRGRYGVALLYFWGLTLSVQAIATPSLGQDFPDPDFFMYWWMHLMTVWAAVFLVFGLVQGPDWRGYWFTVACTAVWAVVMIAVNAGAGTNFGYLRYKPDTGSILDYFGPWPYYVLVEAVLLLVFWALITWPWSAVRRHQQPPPRPDQRRTPAAQSG
ncbi:MAG: TIGR02206 family membrane protein [Marmoricola sp.]